MNTEVTGLLWDSDRVVGVTAQTPGGPVEIRADLIVGCDGRSSVIREQSGLPITEFPMPIDVLWFRLPRNESAPETLGYLGDGQIIIARLGDDVTVKRLKRRPNGIELIAENPDYDNIFVETGSAEFALEGIAVGLIRPGEF